MLHCRPPWHKHSARPDCAIIGGSTIQTPAAATTIRRGVPSLATHAAHIFWSQAVTVAVDGMNENAVVQLLRLGMFLRASRSVLGDLRAELRLKLSRPGCGDRVTSDEVLPYLQSCRVSVERVLAELASGYSAVRWLWYLRRLAPRIWPADAYIPNLAEAITGLHGGAASDPTTGPFDMRESVINRVLRFCGGAQFL
jgi:hypothetical protein